MERLLEGDEQLERELAPERVFAPALGSLLLHGGLVALAALYVILSGMFHPTMWGSPGQGGVMNANLVTSPMPLPTREPPNDNVLATQTPSKAPELPDQKTQEMQDLQAIPIRGKKVKQKKETVHKAPKVQPPPQRQNVARYGEQSGSNMQRSIQQQGFSGQTAIQNGNFGTQFPWYATMINNKVDQNWYRTEVNASTPKGARAYIAFTIHGDGSATNVQISQSSGSSTLDYSCLHAVERVQQFPPLPGGYREITVNFYCEY